MARPCEFVFDDNGAVREVVVNKEEPEWSINFKKALIVLFQTKVDSYSWELEENRVSRYIEIKFVIAQMIVVTLITFSFQILTDIALIIF